MKQIQAEVQKNEERNEEVKIIQPVNEEPKGSLITNSEPVHAEDPIKAPESSSQPVTVSAPTKEDIPTTVKAPKKPKKENGMDLPDKIDPSNEDQKIKEIREENATKDDAHREAQATGKCKKCIIF